MPEMSSRSDTIEWLLGSQPGVFFLMGPPTFIFGAHQQGTKAILTNQDTCAYPLQEKASGEQVSRPDFGPHHTNGPPSPPSHYWTFGGPWRVSQGPLEEATITPTHPLGRSPGSDIKPGGKDGLDLTSK